MYIIYVTVICIPIYNHINQIRHVQQHYETLSVVNILINLLTLYDLQYMTIYNVCCLLLEYYRKSLFLTLVIHVINQTWIVDDLLSNDYTVFNMLRWNTTTHSIKVCSIDVYLLFDRYLHSNTITSIMSSTFNNLTNLQWL